MVQTMSELFAAGGVLGSAALAGYGLKLLNDIVGPSIKSVGSTFGDLVDYRMRNWIRIGENAQKMKKSKSSAEESVHPRVVKKVLEDATFYDDPVMQAYAGGLLASARTEEGTDDQSVYYLDLLSRMPASVVRLHHVLYSVHRDGGIPQTATRRANFANASWKIPIQELIPAVYPSAKPPVSPLGSDLSILSSLDLIYPIGWGSERTATGVEILVGGPSNTGVDLYLFAHGQGAAAPMTDLFRDDLPDFDPPGPRLSGGARFVDLLDV